MDREGWCAAVHGVAWVGYDWVIELNWKYYLSKRRNQTLSRKSSQQYGQPDWILRYLDWPVKNRLRRASMKLSEIFHRMFPYMQWQGCSPLMQFSGSVMSNSLWPHESQHTRPPCASPTPGVGVQGTLRSLLQHHSSEASILWQSAFFTVQLSNSYMTTGKTIALTRQTFVGKLMSLLFNMLSR